MIVVHVGTTWRTKRDFPNSKPNVYLNKSFPIYIFITTHSEHLGMLINSCTHVHWKKNAFVLAKTSDCKDIISSCNV